MKTVQADRACAGESLYCWHKQSYKGGRVWKTYIFLFSSLKHGIKQELKGGTCQLIFSF